MSLPASQASFTSLFRHLCEQSMQSIELGLEAAAALERKNQVVCKKQQQNHLP